MGKVRRSHRRIDKDKYFKGQYWGGDCTGFKTPSIVTGYTYALVLIEFHTRFKESYFGVNKDADWIISLLKKWDEEHLSIWRYVHREEPNFWFHLLADNLEIKYPEIIKFLHSIGVRPHFTCPGHSSTNGLAERAIQTIDLKERTYRIKQGKPEEFWALSWETATHLSNVVVWQYLGKYHLDPYTDYYGRTWDYSLLQEPLSKCFATIRDRLKTEEVQKSTMAVFGAYGKDTNAYKVYIPETNSITTSGDIYFPRDDSYSDILVDPDESEDPDSNNSNGEVEGRTDADPSGRAEVDPLLSTESGDTRGRPQVEGIDLNGVITDYKLWFPSAVKSMENF
jgi:hypothetical protein